MFHLLCLGGKGDRFFCCCLFLFCPKQMHSITEIYMAGKLQDIRPCVILGFMVILTDSCCTICVHRSLEKN